MTTLKKWLPLAFLATVFVGLAYAGIQQSYRQSANDPQVQMAEDAATALASGSPLSLSSPSIDIAKSLAPYLVVYDDSGKPVSGNGMLEGALPNLPSGVFDSVRIMGEDRFTWQPRASVRSAVVLVKIDGGTKGFVMAGRSLTETEKRTGTLTLFAGAAWLFALIGTFVLIAFLK